MYSRRFKYNSSKRTGSMNQTTSAENTKKAIGGQIGMCGKDGH